MALKGSVPFSFFKSGIEIPILSVGILYNSEPTIFQTLELIKDFTLAQNVLSFVFVATRQ